MVIGKIIDSNWGQLIINAIGYVATLVAAIIYADRRLYKVELTYATKSELVDVVKSVMQEHRSEEKHYGAPSLSQHLNLEKKVDVIDDRQRDIQNDVLIIKAAVTKRKP